MQLAVSSVRGQGRRLVSALVAVVLAVAFVAVTLLTGATLEHSLTRVVTDEVGDASVVVTAADGSRGAGARVPLSSVDRIDALPGVETVSGAVASLVQARLSGQDVVIMARTPRPDDGALTSGRRPAATGEVAVSSRLAEEGKLSVGSTLTLVPPAPDQPAPTARVVGVIEPSGLVAMPQTVYAGAVDIGRWTGQPGYSELLVKGTGDPGALREQVRALPGLIGNGTTVRTGSDEIASRISDLGASTRVLTLLLLGFAGIAVLVSSMVIANTFGILLAQRTRELALLRCVGARRRQVFGSVVVEALLLGLLGSLVGLAAGLGLAQVLIRSTRGTAVELGSLHVTPTALLVPVLVGVVVTVLASVVPARRATRVAPLAALRPTGAVAARRLGRVRLGVGLVLAAVGGALLVLGASGPSLPLGLAGGVLSFVGVLLLSVVLVPALARAVGGVAGRLTGVPGELAADNTARNPQRAATTASALLVGVALITMMSVGAATAQRGVDDEIDRRSPVDVALHLDTASVPPALTSALAADRDVRASGTVWSPRAEVPLTLAGSAGGSTGGSAAGSSDGSAADAGRPLSMSVQAVSPEAARASRYPAYFVGLAPGTVLLPASLDVADGASVVVGQGAKAVTLRASVSPDRMDAAVVTPETLRRLDPAATSAVWVRLADGVDTSAAVGRVGETAQRVVPGVQVDPSPCPARRCRTRCRSCCSSSPGCSPSPCSSRWWASATPSACPCSSATRSPACCAPSGSRGVSCGGRSASRRSCSRWWGCCSGSVLGWSTGGRGRTRC
ncbi:hypothetical protein GCM10025862_00680 [Arsenicicoccus piscis]|uniref:ABC3 transporter permease protein domain-containing protein n=1 Tax=Arsenicicoccus piscis TaxID=673954 RepID=A0ABQ6HIZ9_9MICO|nr:hypothetical protein GCM10025862_00680 [Arsenicicoccus piscis]